MAMRIFRLLRDDNGRLDWAGLPLLAAWLGVRDVDGLLFRLAAMKLYVKTEPET